MRDNDVRIVSGVYKIPQTGNCDELINILEFEENAEQVETIETDDREEAETSDDIRIEIDDNIDFNDLLYNLLQGKFFND